VSRIRLREADRFSEVVLRLAMVEVKRFWIAPMSARELFTDFRALSTIDRAFWAPATVEMFRSPTEVLVVDTTPPPVLVWVRPRPAAVAAVAPVVAVPP